MKKHNRRFSSHFILSSRHRSFTCTQPARRLRLGASSFMCAICQYGHWLIRVGPNGTKAEQPRQSLCWRRLYEEQVGAQCIIPFISSHEVITEYNFSRVTFRERRVEENSLPEIIIIGIDIGSGRGISVSNQCNLCLLGLALLASFFSQLLFLHLLIA
jgi:hypothetical protein